MDGDMIPVADVIVGIFDELEFLFWIIDECAYLSDVRLSDVIAKEFVDLSLDVT